MRELWFPTRRGHPWNVRLLRRAAFLTILLSVLAGPVGSTTEYSVLSTQYSASAAGAVTVTNTSAKPQFPNAIAFHLEATAVSGEITGVNLLYHAAGTLTTKRVPVQVERGQRIKLD